MKKRSSSFKFLLSLLQLVLPYKWQFGLGLLALFLGSAINLALPQLAKLLIDQHFRELVLKFPVWTTLLIAGAFAIQNIFFYFRSIFFSEVGARVTNSLRTRLFSSLLYKELSFHDVNDWADTRSRLINDIQLIQDAVGLRLSVFLRYAIQVLCGAFLMAWISPFLGLLALCSIPVIVVTGVGLGRKLKNLSSTAQEGLAEIGRAVDDGLGQIKLIKALSAEQDILKRFILHSSAVLDAWIRRTRFAGFFSSFINFLLNAALVFVVVYGLFLVNAGSMSSGELTAFLLYGAIVAVSFAFVVSSYTELIQASAAGDRIFSLLEDANGHDIKHTSQVREGSIGDQIIFDAVSFSYPSRESLSVLSDLSVTFPSNSCTAIVGSSGGGKSTIANLLLKLYPAKSGRILINGAELKAIDTQALRQKIAVVPQDAPLISASIRENLLLGNTSQSDQDLLAVIDQVNLGEFVGTLPEGLATTLGERGVQLSGGQRQRLAIARALLRKPSTLILDEATSALDSENEGKLLEIISKMKQSTTVVLISHRLSTLKVADRIIVIQGGRVAQQGTYEEVVHSAGLFRSMLETAQLEGN